MTQIDLNSFVLRQTEFSPFSYFSGSKDDLRSLVTENLWKATPGYKDGVLLVPVPPGRFFSGVVEITPTTLLRAVFEARREGETAHLAVRASGPKLPAKVVEIVLYRKDVLGDEATTGADWEIISINARPTEGQEPMHPMAMARNALELPGGTSATYSSEEFAQAILYWSTRAMYNEGPSK